MKPRRLLGALLACLTPVATLGLVAASMVGGAGSASAASLQEVTGFGNNPGALRMYVYVPPNVKSPAPLLVVNHWCGGDAPTVHGYGAYSSQADLYGFMLLYPSVTASDKCFDVASSGTLTHNGGGDSLSIISMVNYVKSHYSIDSSRVYATGISSGAMMTEVLLGAYPDVFAAGSAFAGVPFGCFAGSSKWNGACSQGQINKTPQEWGDLVRNAYPGYTGPRPRVQLWHGTNDETLNYLNHTEAIEQWTNVAGISQTPSSSASNTPTSGTTRTRYNNASGTTMVEAYSMAGVSHNLTVDVPSAIRFFGLDNTTTTTTTTRPTTTTTQPTTTTTTTTRPTTTSTSTTTTTTPAGSGIQVRNGRLYEANGAELVLRGTSHAHTWYPSQTSAFSAIGATGANSVRTVLSGGRWTANSASDVANVISLAKQAKLISIVEDHDTTGYNEQSGAYTLDQAVDYWISVKSALVGQEDYVILNIGNEPYGNGASTTEWTTATANAIKKLRANGFRHTIMVDAPNWGQDWGGIMKSTAAQVYAADPTGNTVFSIHMYGVYDTAAEVTGYIDSFLNAKLPIVVGEFGFNHSDGNPDEDTIMSYSTQKNVGYLAWSWSGNGGGVEYLDMVNGFNASSLTTWGDRVINGANGFKATSKKATIFGGTTTTTTTTTSRPTTTTTPATSPTTTTTSPTTTTTSPTTTTTTPTTTTTTPTTTTTTRPTTTTTTTTPTQGGKSCSATYAVTGQWPSGFQGDVKVTAGGSAIASWKVTWTFANGQAVTQAWGGKATQSGAVVTATNEAWNGSLGAGASTNLGFIGSWNNSTNSVPAVTCTAS